MNYININKRITREICYKTIDRLKDSHLLSEYKNCKSVKIQISKLSDVLNKHGIDNDTKQNIINDYMIEMIPPGTKGVIRGNKFNEIIKETILDNFDKSKSEYDVCFEENCPIVKTDEKPDWYILQKSTNKVIIGMNQLDFWKGGHQSNRGYKYILNNKLNTKNTKFLSVICNEIKFKNNRNKAFKLFEIGFKNDTLCYRNNLINIIHKFFGL
jgi:hypothetical protein